MIDLEKAINVAYKEAEKAFDKDEVPIGAVIILNNKIISKAHNLTEKNHDVTAHAEILAIKKAAKKLNDWRLNNATLITTLEPCPMCADAIQKSRIKNVIYTARDPKGGVISLGLADEILGNKKRNHQLEIKKTDFLEEKCSKILKTFFKNKRK